MPLAVAALIRVLIQAGVTTAIFSAVDWILTPLINAAKSAVKFAFGMTDEEAENKIADQGCRKIGLHHKGICKAYAFQ